jgi:hypothetical protein
LIWDPKDLPVQRKWFEDGPLAQVEFLRQSGDLNIGPITLVLNPTGPPVRLLWTMMRIANLKEGKQALRVREALKGAKWATRIGVWQTKGEAPSSIPDLPDWANELGLEAVIWTALGPKFEENEIAPSMEQVIEYLDGLTETPRAEAERYVRRAPRQIDTDYRRGIEDALGWTFQDC